MNTPTPIRMIIPNSTDIRTDAEVRIGVGDTEPSVMPSVEQILDCLVAQNGMPSRVAVSLGVTEEYILSVVSRNARTLSTKLRARLMLSSFTTMLKIDSALQLALEEMPADAVGRTYAATLGAFTNLAGQFEEQEAQGDTDDAAAAKLSMLDRLDGMDKRERAMQEAEDSG